MTRDWSINIIGDIVNIEKENVDKSGRNQKFFYEFHVRPESVEGWMGQSKYPLIFVIRVKDVELYRLSSEKLCVGDRIVMGANANGPNPTLFYLKTVKKLIQLKNSNGSK